MANEKTTLDGVFIGDFEFKFEGNFFQKTGDYLAAIFGGKSQYEKIVNDMMAKHYEFYGILEKKNNYVTSGSKLWCNMGKNLSMLDIPISHGVTSGNAIGICTDCQANYNIYTFGSCSQPTPKGYPERPRIDGQRYKCIPMLAQSWHKVTNVKVQVWDESNQKYSGVLKEADVLSCFYGGTISVVEVPSKTFTSKVYITLQQMQSLGWSKIHCGYNLKGTQTQSPISDMQSEIERRHRDINQDDIDKINHLFDAYDINTKKRICAFFAECSAETSNGYGLIEQAVDSGNPALQNIKYIFTAKPTRANLQTWFDDNRKYKFLYRGGGIIQLTWNYHYLPFRTWMTTETGKKDDDIVDLGAEYVATTYPWETGVFYWDYYNLNAKADLLNNTYIQGDILKITNVVNSGMSQSEKQKRDDAYKHWMNVFII